jgi:hypothetical protein
MVMVLTTWHGSSKFHLVFNAGSEIHSSEPKFPEPAMPLPLAGRSNVIYFGGRAPVARVAAPEKLTTF